MVNNGAMHLPNVCPFCGKANNFEYSKEYLHNDTIVFPWKCDCGASGREVYYLDFVRHENLEKGVKENDG